MEASAHDSTPGDRRFRVGVAAATLAGAAVRLGMLIPKWNRPLAYSDAWYYSLQAINNAHGKWFKEAGGPLAGWGKLPGAEHPPLTSVVITPASLLPHAIFWQRATITLLGILLVPFIGLIARRIGGPVVGVIAAGIAAVYPNIWMSDSVVMSETITKLGVLLVILAAVRHVDRFDLRSAAVLGAAVGLAGYARSELIFYAPLLALVGVRSYPWKEWLRRAGVLVAATAVVVVPWVIYNTSRFDTLVVMSTNDGNTLLGANCNFTYGGPSMGGWIIGCIEVSGERPGENSAQRSARRRHEALAFMKAHASRVPAVLVARALRGADLFRVAENVRADLGEEQPAWAVWAGMYAWWVLAPCAAFGLWRMRRRLRFVLLVPVVGAAVVAVVFYGSHRLRAPMEPVVVIAAASALAQLPFARRLSLSHRFSVTPATSESEVAGVTESPVRG